MFCDFVNENMMQFMYSKTYNFFDTILVKSNGTILYQSQRHNIFLNSICEYTRNKNDNSTVFHKKIKQQTNSKIDVNRYINQLNVTNANFKNVEQ